MKTLMHKPVVVFFLASLSLLANADDNSAGFDFTRLCHSGEAAGSGHCPANPQLGSKPNDWGCTRDNTTGLIWEVKTPANMNITQTAIDATRYVRTANSSGLCGFTSGWRVPTREELSSLVDLDAGNPAIDSDYFPNTVGVSYWSSEFYVHHPVLVWAVNFHDGAINAFNQRYDLFRVRLVHDGE